MHHFNRGRAKKLLSRASDAQPLLYITVSLQQRERARLGPKRNALAKPRSLVVYFFLEFRLASKDNLQQFLRGSLQICQQPNLLEHLGG
jgi:hypothetical protein